MNVKSQLVVSLAALTDPGKLRDHNEDDFVIVPDVDQTENLEYGRNSFVLGDGGCIMVVADGMGGAAAGEVASQATTQLIKRYLLANPLPKYDHVTIIPFLEFLIHKCYENIVRLVNESPVYRGMGTTIVLGWINDNKVTVCWVGDSRCYHFSNKTGCQLKTNDHSWVWELVMQNKMSIQEANEHENRNIITRCVGDSPTAPVADFVTFPIEKGDRLLLCSDGLNSMIDDEQIARILSSREDASLIVQQLVQAANDAGGEDNITVTLLEVLEQYNDNQILNRFFWNKVKGIFS